MIDIYSCITCLIWSNFTGRICLLCGNTTKIYHILLYVFFYCVGIKHIQAEGTKVVVPFLVLLLYDYYEAPVNLLIWTVWLKHQREWSAIGWWSYESRNCLTLIFYNIAVSQCNKLIIFCVLNFKHSNEVVEHPPPNKSGRAIWHILVD